MPTFDKMRFDGPRYFRLLPRHIQRSREESQAAKGLLRGGRGAIPPLPSPFSSFLCDINCTSAASSTVIFRHSLYRAVRMGIPPQADSSAQKPSSSERLHDLLGCSQDFCYWAPGPKLLMGQSLPIYWLILPESDITFRKRPGSSVTSKRNTCFSEIGKLT